MHSKGRPITTRPCPLSLAAHRLYTRQIEAPDLASLLLLNKTSRVVIPATLRFIQLRAK